MVKKLLVYLVAFLLLASSAFGAVSISGTTGTFANGQAVTITGSGFGTGPTTPWRWETFESGTSAYLNQGIVTVNDNRTNSTYNMEAQGSYLGLKFYYPGGAIAAGTEVFMSTWFWIPADFAWVATPDDQVKIFRSYHKGSVPDGHPNSHFQIRNAPYVSMMLTEESGSIVPGGVRAYYIPGGAPNIVRGSWNRIDWNFKLSSAEAAADGFHKLYIDGKKLADLTQVSNLDSGDGNTLQHTEITMPNTSRTPTAAMQPHYDDVYITFTRARVEICENSTWDNTVKKHCEIQPTTSWADGSIGITVNAGSWAGLNDLFIYVVAADGTVNTNGYSVGAGDVISPEMSTSAIGLNGAEFTINYTEAVSQGVSYNDNQLNIDCTQGGNDVGMTYASGNTTNSHVYTLASTININDTCNLDFDGTANSLEDGAGNDLAAIVNGTVINNSGAGSTQSVTGIVTGGANAPNIEKGGANAPDIQ